MKFKIIYLLTAIYILASCHSASHITMNNAIRQPFDFQAHRGGRGLMPENTIPAMLSVMDNNKVTTLEMDLAITKDKQVVVSHDPVLNPIITTKPDGTFIKANAIGENVIYQMDYVQLQKFDVGLKIHPGFPQQEKLAVAVPTLNDLVDSVEIKGNIIGRKMMYNIEIKSVEGKDIVEHPAPDEFVELVVNIIKQKNIVSRTTIQSFDIRPLKVLHQKYPNIQIAYLVEGKETPNVKTNIAKLGFTPTIYSPEYKFVTKETVDYCHANNMKIIPWTVNTKTEIDALIALGVDGLITDYPNLF
jgi:glycerophosphoryl diester phosphodiesterase